MRGGLGCGKFYINEINAIERKWSEKAPQTKLDPEEIEAGYDRLDKSFGFYRTLLYMEKETPFNRKQLLTWNVAEFKHNLLFLSWKGVTDKKLIEILKNKK
jgi:hypothetical protein